jgi:SAM-dependent methyltransferase
VSHKAGNVRAFRRFVAINCAVSRWLDRFVPPALQVDGNRHFKEVFARKYFEVGQLIYDIGGGKQPFLSVVEKSQLRSQVVGLDISAGELSRAPTGAYDTTLVADIRSFVGKQNADLVICQALLEHVPDVDAALTSVASILKPGGTLLLFVPCRNAAFARLNLMLPERLKRRILFGVFPSARESQGFVSYYNACTPSQIASISKRRGMKQLEIRRYYMSGYFHFLVPLFVIWRLWTIAIASRANDLCETFAMALQKADIEPDR